MGIDEQILYKINHFIVLEIKTAKRKRNRHCLLIWAHLSYCNKLSLDVLKIHYMIFTARHKMLLTTLVDSQRTWKQHIDYTCKKLCKCFGILAKTRKMLCRPSLLTLYYSLAKPYLTNCNCVWGNETALIKHLLVQKEVGKNNNVFSMPS